MSSLVIALVVLGCLLGGALLGLLIRSALPEHHLSAESKETIKLGTGLIATMGALVLGLMVGSAKGSYDTQKAELTAMSAKMILMDRALAHFGPEAADTRTELKTAGERMLVLLWTDPNADLSAHAPSAAKEQLYDLILTLTPKTDAQKSIQSQALSTAVDIGQTRWLLHQQAGSSIPTIFLVLLVFWFATIFFSIGLFAPINLTVIASIALCAVSVAAALFLILELDHPFSGMIQIPSDTLRNAIAQLGR
jgi:hypothetical protein